MKNKIIAILACLLSATMFAADAVLAEALAATGASYAAKGKVEAAKDALYKALANDENCGTALLELGKIAEKEGAKADAQILFQRAAESLRDPQKKAYAEAKVRADNPYAARLDALLKDYSKCLQVLMKKDPSPVIREEVERRATAMGLIMNKPAEPAKPVFNPVGKWTKGRLATDVMTLKEDHSLLLCGVGGKWSFSDGKVIVDYANEWGHAEHVVKDSDTMTDPRFVFTRILRKN